MRGPVKAVRTSADKFDVITASRVHKFKVPVGKTEFGESAGKKEVEQWVALINKAIWEQNNGGGMMKV